MPLSRFHPLIAEWFHSNVGVPTDVQTQAWPVIQSGMDVLIAAPTGSGKTFAAFLSCIDHLFKQALARELDDHTQVLYVSPLKALSNDIQKNLQQPLAEIGTAAMSASDPLNLAGIILPGSRVPAVPSNFVVFRDGVVVRTVLGREAAGRLGAQIESSEYVRRG